MGGRRMEANELMLGDWVYLSKTHKYSIQVVLLDEDECHLNFIGNEVEPFEGNFGENGVQPIPLTREMLLENGFTKFVDGYQNLSYNYMVDNNLVLHISDWEDEGLKAVIGGKFRKLKYVHELQHILRLIGLSEMADNFKIK